MGNICFNVGLFFSPQKLIIIYNMFCKKAEEHFSRMLINDYDVFFDTTKKFPNR